MTAAVTTLAYNGNGLTATNFRNSTGANIGGWTTFSDVGTICGMNSQLNYVTSTAGDYVSYDVPSTAHSVWMVLRVTNGNLSGNPGKAILTALSIKIDGVDQRGNFAIPIDSYAYGQSATLYYLPISHWNQHVWNDGLGTGAGGLHNVKVVCYGSGASSVQFDAFMTVTSRAAAPAVQNAAGAFVPTGFTVIGDSYAAGGGASSTAFTRWPDRFFTEIIEHFQTYNITYNNLGVNGDLYFGTSASAVKTGGMYRTATNFAAAPTSWLAYCFGTNDLSVFSVGAYLFAVKRLVSLLPDLVDLTHMKVVIPTPSYRTAFAMCSATPLVANAYTAGLTGAYYFGTPVSTDQATAAILRLAGTRPWLNIVDLSNAADGDDHAWSPNSSNPPDGGNHANDQGVSSMEQAYEDVFFNDPQPDFHGYAR